jgi:hypothetical protein
MEQNLMSILDKLGYPEFGRTINGSIVLIEGVETSLQVKLPEDYKQLLLLSNGGSIKGPKTAFNYEPAEYLVAHNEDEIFTSGIPGTLVIGDDGGGCIYYYDMHDQTGKGKWSLHYVSMAVLEFEKSVFVGKDLTEMINRILAGEHFGDMLYK